MIPLEKDLEHVKIYAEIEMTRFPNIRVEYDIRERRRAKCSVRRTAPSSWNRKIKRLKEERREGERPSLRLYFQNRCHPPAEMRIYP